MLINRTNVCKLPVQHRLSHLDHDYQEAPLDLLDSLLYKCSMPSGTINVEEHLAVS